MSIQSAVCRHWFRFTLLANFDFYLCLRINFHTSSFWVLILAAGGPYWVLISQKNGSLLGPYLKAWGSLLVLEAVVYIHLKPHMSFILILIIFQRSQRPKPFGVPDLFFQPLDNSNWTMLDLRWDSLIIRGHFVFCTDARIASSERQNSQIKEKWQGLGVL